MFLVPLKAVVGEKETRFTFMQNIFSSKKMVFLLEEGDKNQGATGGVTLVLIFDYSNSYFSAINNYKCDSESIESKKISVDEVTRDKFLTTEFPALNFPTSTFPTIKFLVIETLWRKELPFKKPTKIWAFGNQRSTHYWC